MPVAPTDPRSFHVPATESRAATVPTAPAPPPRSRRRWATRLLATLAALAVLLGGYVAVSAWASWRGVEKVELSEVLAGARSGTNYLVVGTDSRAGVDTDDPNAGVIFGEGVGGERTDTIAVLHRGADGFRLLAVPRDLFVDIGGESNRINAAFAFGGPVRLVETVQRELGIGLDHYLEVDFAGFLSLVDALDGVTVDFPYPAYDTKSGLRVDTAGPVELDRTAALAYVRSRNYVEITPDGERRDPTADLGRVQRQQRFLAAVFAELGATRNPFTLLAALRGVSANVRVDDGMGLRDALSLGWALRGADPDSATVPTVPHTTASGAQVLLLDGSAAGGVIDPFR